MSYLEWNRREDKSKNCDGKVNNGCTEYSEVQASTGLAHVAGHASVYVLCQ